MHHASSKYFLKTKACSFQFTSIQLKFHSRAKIQPLIAWSDKRRSRFRRCAKVSLGRQFHNCFADQKRPVEIITSVLWLRCHSTSQHIHWQLVQGTPLRQRHWHLERWPPRSHVHAALPPRCCPHPHLPSWPGMPAFLWVNLIKPLLFIQCLDEQNTATSWNCDWIIELVDASWKIWWSPSKFHVNYGGTPFGFLVLKIYMQPRKFWSKWTAAWPPVAVHHSPLQQQWSPSPREFFDIGFIPALWTLATKKHQL